MRKTYNILPPIAIVVSIWLCASGRVSWWVFLMFVMFESKLIYTRKG